MNATNRVFVAVFAALAVVGCTTNSGGISETLQATPPEKLGGKKGYFAKVHWPISRARKVRVGKTSLTHGGGHGTQIYYMAPGGKGYLWYPGNEVVLESEWELRKAPDVRASKGRGANKVTKKVSNTLVCYRYGENTYNPVTRRGGGDWQCMSVSLMESFAKIDRRDGDIFGLAKRRSVPFITKKDRRYTFAELLANCRSC